MSVVKSFTMGFVPDKNWLILLGLLRQPAFGVLRRYLIAVISPTTSTLDETELDKLFYKALEKFKPAIDLYGFTEHELEKIKNLKQRHASRERNAVEKKEISGGCKTIWSQLDIPLRTKLILCLSAASIDKAKEWTQELVRQLPCPEKLDSYVWDVWKQKAKKLPSPNEENYFEIKSYSEIDSTTVKDLICALPKTKKSLKQKVKDTKSGNCVLNHKKWKPCLIEALKCDPLFCEDEAKRIELEDAYLNHQLRLVLSEYTKSRFDKEKPPKYDIFHAKIQKKDFLRQESTYDGKPLLGDAKDDTLVREIMPYSDMKPETILNLIEVFSENSSAILRDDNSDRKNLRHDLLQALENHPSFDSDEAKRIELKDSYVNHLLRLVLPKYVLKNAIKADANPLKIESGKLVKCDDRVCRILGPVSCNKFLDKVEKNRPPFTDKNGECNRRYKDWLFKAHPNGSSVSPITFMQHKGWFEAAPLIDLLRQYRNHIHHMGEDVIEEEDFREHRENIIHVLKALDCKSMISNKPETLTDHELIEYLALRINLRLRKKTRKGRRSESKEPEELLPTLSVVDRNGTDCKDLIVAFEQSLKDFREIGAKFNRNSKYQQALEVLKKVRQHYERLSSPYEVIDCDYKIAISYWDLGNYGRAKVMFSEALDRLTALIRETCTGAHKVESVETWQAKRRRIRREYASLLIDLGEYEAAGRELKDAAPLERERDAWKHFLIRGNLNCERNKYEEARRDYEKSLTLLRKRIEVEKHSPLVLEWEADSQHICSNIASVILKHAMQLKEEEGMQLKEEEDMQPSERAKLITEALERFREILAYFDKQADDAFDSSETVDVRNNLAIALFELQRYEEALMVHEEVLEQRVEIFGTEHRKSVDSLDHVASVLFELGKYHGALDKHEQVLAYWRKKNDRKANIQRSNVARCHVKLYHCHEAVLRTYKELADLAGAALVYAALADEYRRNGAEKDANFMEANEDFQEIVKVLESNARHQLVGVLKELQLDEAAAVVYAVVAVNYGPNSEGKDFVVQNTEAIEDLLKILKVLTPDACLRLQNFLRKHHLTSVAALVYAALADDYRSQSAEKVANFMEALENFQEMVKVLDSNALRQVSNVLKKLDLREAFEEVGERLSEIGIQCPKKSRSKRKKGRKKGRRKGRKN